MKKKNYERLKKQAIRLSKEVFRLFGAALYWAKGSKGRMLELTNSDPNMLTFMVRWINLILEVPPRAYGKAKYISPTRRNRNKKVLVGYYWNTN